MNMHHASLARSTVEYGSAQAFAALDKDGPQIPKGFQELPIDAETSLVCQPNPGCDCHSTMKSPTISLS